MKRCWQKWRSCVVVLRAAGVVRLFPGVLFLNYIYCKHWSVHREALLPNPDKICPSWPPVTNCVSWSGCSASAVPSKQTLIPPTAGRKHPTSNSPFIDADRNGQSPFMQVVAKITHYTNSCKVVLHMPILLRLNVAAA